jgi:multiple sugar transport system ATP-binding protein
MRPVNQFVAGFIGSPAMNFLPGRVTRRDNVVVIKGDGDWEYALSPENSARALAATGAEVILGARHTHVRLHSAAQPGALQARVYTVEPTGDVTFVHVRLGEHILVASTDPSFRTDADAPIWLDFDQTHLHLFDGQTRATLAAEGAPAAASAR